MTSQLDNLAKDMFLTTLKSILLKKGYKECSSEYSFNKFKSTYSIDLVNSFGTMQTYIFEIHGVPLNNELLLYGSLVEPSEYNKGVSIRIRVKLNQDINLLNSNVESKFVAKLKELASPSINDLPVEIKLHLLKYLTVKSVINLSQTSQTWYNLIHKSNIWKLLCKRDFGMFDICI
jgi:F-box domain